MPVPRITPDTRDFWDACREQKLVVQRCGQCRTYRFAPSPICPCCQSAIFTNVESLGAGEVFTWTVTYRTVHPAVNGNLPFNVAVIRLNDCGGAFITSNLIDVRHEDIYAGMPVEVVWDRINERITLPRFRRLASGSQAR